MRAKRETFAARDLQVVHRDADLLVVVKPAGLATTAPGNGPSLVRLVHELDPRAPRLHATSRLDADVTGLVTFARTVRANDALLAARREGRYRRCYVALASPPPGATSGTWSWDIALDRRDPRLRAAVGDEEDEDAKEAVTDFTVVATAGVVAALHLRPRTGRTHQLRVHASRALSPLLGDVAYGGAARIVLADGRVVTARRPMLHCAWLSLPRPNGAPLVLTADIPPDLAAVWTAVGGDALLSPREKTS